MLALLRRQVSDSLAPIPSVVGFLVRGFLERGQVVPLVQLFCFECGALTQNDVTSDRNMSFTDEIEDEFEDEINEEYEQPVEENEDITLCPLCRAAIDRRDKFCRVCGVELNLVEDDEIICPGCGTIVKKKDSFCRECGHSFIPQKKVFIPNTEYETETDAEDEDDEEDLTESSSLGKNRTFAVTMLFLLILINIIIVYFAVAGNR